jgi:ABC-2 type transport system ATP-binding protein
VNPVEATGLVKRFESTTALDGVNLALAAGEIRGLLGPNGAGKTTLLEILFGLIRIDAGRVKLFGRDLDGPGTAALRGVAGFVEEPRFYPYLSGRANLSLLARFDGGNLGAAQIDDALCRVELGRRADDRVSGYSTGMRQRLGLAAALIRQPRLMLLDEPTSGLDPAGTRAFVALLKDLAAQGVAVLISSHQIGELENVCTSYTILRQGRVVWDGTATELEAQAPASAYRLSTSDDEQTLELVAKHGGVRAQRGLRGGLVLAATPDALDEFVLVLGEARVAVRRLELAVSPLELTFFALTSEQPLGEVELRDLAERAIAV